MSDPLDADDAGYDLEPQDEPAPAPKPKPKPAPIPKADPAGGPSVYRPKSGATDEPSVFRPRPRAGSGSGGPKKDAPTPAPAPDAGGEPSAFRPNPRPKRPGSGTGTGSRPRSRPAASAADGPDAPGPDGRGTGEAPGWWERVLYGRVGSGQLATFCRQLAAYLRAGIGYQKALGDLARQFGGTALGPVLGRVQGRVRQGDTLTDAFRAEPQCFDAFFLAMIRVAEERGGVPETLHHLGRHYEARLRLIRQARSAMIYPVAVLLVASGVVTLLTVWVLPIFADLLKELAGRGAELPLPSRVLLAFSAFMGAVGWVAVPAAAVGVPFLLLWSYRTPAGKAILDRVLLRMPVFGGLLRKLDTTRFARSLGLLLDAGVDTGRSLDLTGDVLRLAPFRNAVRAIKADVTAGRTLSDAIDHTGAFGPDVVAVVGSGEETGQVPETLAHLADDYEQQVEYTVRNLGQLVQPMLILVLGGVVLFIVLAVLLPYISMINNLTR